MRTCSKVFAFVALGALLLFVPHTAYGYAYYQGSPSTGQYTATVKTDKSSYSAGEPITISGQVKPYEKGRELKVSVLSSTKKILFHEAVHVNSDASYSVTIKDTLSWKKDTYMAIAQYGKVDVESAWVKFRLDEAKIPSTAGSAGARSGAGTTPPGGTTPPDEKLDEDKSKKKEMKLKASKIKENVKKEKKLKSKTGDALNRLK